MLKSLSNLFARLAALKPGGAARFEPTPHLAVKAGDVVLQPADGGWQALKVIAVEGVAAHCLTYELSASKPCLASLAHAEVRLAHVQKSAASFADGWELAGNQPATARELQGLKFMDFDLYLRLTGQDAATIERTAREHYAKAGSLREQGRSTDAIREYGKAIDLFPLFPEALDGRAHAFMELGLHQQALRDLEESLDINPDGAAAFFSKGECLMKLGYLDEAAALFEEGQQRFPDAGLPFNDFLKRTRVFALTGRPS